MPLRTSALRSLGAFANVFAIESLLDELAAEARRRRPARTIACALLPEPRARGRARSAPRSARTGPNGRQREGRGHGIGFARYKGTGAWCAVVAEVEAGREIRVGG